MQAVPQEVAEGAVGSVDDMGQDPSFSVEAQSWGNAAQHHRPLPQALPGVLEGLGSGHVVPDVGWPGVVPLWLLFVPFPVFHPTCWSPVWKLEETGPGYPLGRCAAVPKHHLGFQGLLLDWLVGGDSARFRVQTCVPLYIYVT